MKRSAYRHHLGSHSDSFEEPETTDELVFTGEDLSQVDDTFLTGIIPLTSLPAPLPAHNIPVTSITLGLVHQSITDSSAFFKAPNPVSQTVSQDISLPGQVLHSTPGRQSVEFKMSALFSTATEDCICNGDPSNYKDSIKNQLEKQNFEMMNTLQQKNKQQVA